MHKWTNSKLITPPTKSLQVQYAKVGRLVAYVGAPHPARYIVSTRPTHTQSYSPGCSRAAFAPLFVYIGMVLLGLACQEGLRFSAETCSRHVQRLSMAKRSWLVSVNSHCWEATFGLDHIQQQPEWQNSVFPCLAWVFPLHLQWCECHPNNKRKHSKVVESVTVSTDRIAKESVRILSGAFV